MELEREILNLLIAGRAKGQITPDAPISGRSIGGLFGNLKDSQVRRVVHRLRMDGHWIAATGDGYFLALGTSEIMPTIESLRERGREVTMPANAMAAKIPSTQTSLEF